MALKTKSAARKKSSLESPQSIRVEWEDAPTEITKKCVLMTVYGDTHTGRTTFALTAPGPIAYFHSAENYDGRVQKYARTKKIRMCNFGAALIGTDKEKSDEAAEVWKGFRAKWFDAFTWARTIVLDTHTDLWELLRFAYFGDVKPVHGRMELNWGPVNAEWSSLFRLYKTQDKTNLVLIGKTKDEWTKPKKGMGEKTGKTVQVGQKDIISTMAEVSVRTDREIRKKGGLIFKSIVEKGDWNGDVLGLELENELSTFPMLMSMITETNVEEWER
jgi:hypothetical protein